MKEAKKAEGLFYTLNGIHETYDPRGNIFVQARFENGVMHGIYKEFFDEERKKMKTEGRYEDGMRQGVWTMYDRRSRVESVEIFNRGEILERTLYDDEE
jgi:antitoxin component YwqK of YwqJK toxin-antitoxin module